MLVCPKCKKQLIKVNNSYECINHHHYDISKRGYVNLALSNKKNRGDDKGMIESRSRFLQHHYYQFMLDEIIRIIDGVNHQIIIDAGCGEGYYTNQIANYFNHSQIYGIDLSKSGIDYASRSKSKACYVVASIADMPFLSQSSDVIISIFAPIDSKEISRVLKDNGIFIQVGPGAKHLLTLKQILYDDVYENKDMIIFDNLQLISKQEIHQDMYLEDNQSIMDLFHMTPYYWKSKIDAKKRLEKYQELKCEACFSIQVYKKAVE